MNPVRDYTDAMLYVYVLENKKKRWYTGSTNNLRKRFKQHNAKRSDYTKQGGPWKLVYYETCINEQDARSREIYLKSGMGKRYLKNRLKCFLSLTG